MTPVVSVRLPVSGAGLAALRCRPRRDTRPLATVVLASGLLGSKEDFLPLLPHLAAYGYDVYAYDHRGQHESEGTDDPDAYSVPALAEDLLRVAAAVRRDVPLQLAGHCVGGTIARTAVVARPDAARSLALISCALHHDARQAALSRLFAAQIDALGTSALRPLIAQWAAAEPQRRTLMEDRLRTTRRAHIVGLTRSIATLAHDDLAGPLARSGVPTLLVHGDKDEATPQEAYRRLEAAVRAECVVVPGAGHTVQIHYPQATARALHAFWHGVRGEGGGGPVPEAGTPPVGRRTAAARPV
ncbi:alpha/beta hydrolase [Streptomyces netropsis]|uniref:alpha/beta hydrolase n=1 Tax=Streptomyces netropsis TaxID=55404 RepID=UPI0037A0FB3A